MLKQIGKETADPSVKISEAKFPAPFVSGLEYGAPARGTWNIVHVGMLIPEAHQIFACAQGCLRGVVLTAAEMNASDRFSTIAIRENNVLDGDMEELLIEGVSDILERLQKRPPAILLYTSCIHHFMGCDLDYVYKVLRERYPMVQFTDCYMNPIMRKSGLTPDQIMRRQLYSLLQPVKQKERCVQIAGCDFRLDRSSELYQILEKGGFEVREIASCETYEEYQNLAQCSRCITTFPAAKAAGTYLSEHCGQEHLYLPASFDYEIIERNIRELCVRLRTECRMDFEKRKEACERALEHAKNVIGDTEIAVDFTAFPFVLSLTKLLVTHGFRVTKLYTDSFPGEEKECFIWLQEHAPELIVYPTVHTAMRVQSRVSREKVLAIGQKAAYFTGTEHFVNVVEGAGLYGYDGIIRLSELMIEAFEKPKDVKSLIQIKGMGCGNCL
ncbi:MAG: nitrogenase component 1 [Lachnospiraceae bacterium]